MPPWTLTANLMFMENFNDPGRGAVLGFSGLAILNDNLHYACDSVRRSCTRLWPLNRNVTFFRTQRLDKLCGDLIRQRLATNLDRGRVLNIGLRIATLASRFLFIFFLAKYLDSASFGYVAALRAVRPWL